MGSKITTRLAETMFKPTPPARVERRNANVLLDALKSSTTLCRCFVLVDPSRRENTYPLRVMNRSRTSSRRVLTLNTSTLSFCACHSRSSFSSAASFPQCADEDRRVKSPSGRSAPPSKRASSPSAISATRLWIRNLCGSVFSSAGSGLSSSRWFETFARIVMHGNTRQYGHITHPPSSCARSPRSPEWYCAQRGAGSPSGGRRWQHRARRSPLSQSHGSSARASNENSAVSSSRRYTRSCVGASSQNTTLSTFEGSASRSTSRFLRVSTYLRSRALSSRARVRATPSSYSDAPCRCPSCILLE